MRDKLLTIIQNVLIRYRSCPFKKFLWCFCQPEKRPVCGQKRKRDSTAARPEASLKDFVPTKKVYCFVRRCLMYILDVDLKKSDPRKYDDSCPILGGNVNFYCLVRKVNLVIAGLKYDTLVLNHFMHGLKFARM